MVTFFAILLVLVVLNVAVLVFSAVDTSSEKASTLAKNISEQSAAKILPMDLITSKYKKAI